MLIFALNKEIENGIKRIIMIQTQLLKADRPYQIISAGGQVGVQVATLIITEDKITAEGYQIDTHSHPVVNYAIKDNLTEDLKYWNGDPDDEWKYTQRLQPEGAVWNKIEVRDVRVLGLVGANNPSVDLEKFVRLVPSIPSNYPYPSTRPPLWGARTESAIRNLKWALERVGIKCDIITNSISENAIHEGQDLNTLGYIPIYLEVADYNTEDCLVKIIIRENDYSDFPFPSGEIAFTCLLTEDTQEFICTVVNCMRELDLQFIKESKRIKFVYRQDSEDKHKWEELLERATGLINETWKNRYQNVLW